MAALQSNSPSRERLAARVSQLIRIGEPFKVAVGNRSQSCGYTRFNYAVYRCSCGTAIVSQVRHVKEKRTISCGCQRRERASSSRRTHGLSETREYHIWLGMRKRCENPACNTYMYYGGRGIRVCERWRQFPAFIEDMGMAPSNQHSIDRINVNGHYEPGNCRWATTGEQSRNTRQNHIVMFRGQEMVLTDACLLAGVPSGAVMHRLKAGWSLQDSLSIPVRTVKDGNVLCRHSGESRDECAKLRGIKHPCQCDCHKVSREAQRIELNGEFLTIKEWSQRTGICKATIRHRLSAGWPVAAILSNQFRYSKQARHTERNEPQ